MQQQWNLFDFCMLANLNFRSHHHRLRNLRCHLDRNHYHSLARSLGQNHRHDHHDGMLNPAEHLPKVPHLQLKILYPVPTPPPLPPPNPPKMLLLLPWVITSLLGVTLRWVTLRNVTSWGTVLLRLIRILLVWHF